MVYHGAVNFMMYRLHPVLEIVRGLELLNKSYQSQNGPLHHLAYFQILAFISMIRSQDYFLPQFSLPPYAAV